MRHAHTWRCVWQLRQLNAVTTSFTNTPQPLLAFCAGLCMAHPTTLALSVSQCLQSTLWAKWLAAWWWATQGDPLLNGGDIGGAGSVCRENGSLKCNSKANNNRRIHAQHTTVAAAAAHRVRLVGTLPCHCVLLAGLILAARPKRRQPTCHRHHSTWEPTGESGCHTHCSLIVGCTTCVQAAHVLLTALLVSRLHLQNPYPETQSCVHACVHASCRWDASQVYGSDAATSARLREGVGGRMKVTEAGLLPLSARGFGDAGVTQNWWLVRTCCCFCCCHC